MPLRRLAARYICIYALGASLPDPADILQFLEAGRAPGESVEIELTLTRVRSITERLEDDKTQRGPGSQRRYRVLDNGAGASIVEMLDPIDRGSRILATGDDLWFFTPRTRRAIRIPPAQRVFGDASYGDLARLRWRNDYDVAFDTTPETSLDGHACWRLQLTARSPAATYRHVILWVRQSDWLPMRAAYYVASGKLLKTVTFPQARVVNGRLQNDVWVISAEGSAGHQTLLSIESVTPRAFPEHQFTRRYLELNP